MNKIKYNKIKYVYLCFNIFTGLTTPSLYNRRLISRCVAFSKMSLPATPQLIFSVSKKFSCWSLCPALFSPIITTKSNQYHKNPYKILIKRINRSQTTCPQRESTLHCEFSLQCASILEDHDTTHTWQPCLQEEPEFKDIKI